MTVYNFSKVAVYAELGGALRLARNARSFATDPVTGAPVNVTQGAFTAPYLDTDSSGIADFTATTLGPIRLTTGGTFVDVYSEELPATLAGKLDATVASSTYGRVSDVVIAAADRGNATAAHIHSRDAGSVRDVIWVPANLFTIQAGTPVFDPAASKAGVRFCDWRMSPGVLSEVATTFMLPAKWGAYQADLYFTGSVTNAGTISLTTSRNAVLAGDALSAGDFTPVAKTGIVSPSSGVLAVVQVDAVQGSPGRLHSTSQTAHRRDGALHSFRVQRPASDTYTGDVLFVGVALRRYVSLSQMVADGNSLTSGMGSTGGLTYPAQLVTLLIDAVTPQVFATPTVTTYGVSGQTTPQMTADAVAQIDSLVFPSDAVAVSDNVLLAWEGTNDLFVNGASAATAYANLVTYCTARRAAGWKVIIGTLLPRADVGTPATFEADRQTVNTLLRQHWREFADALMDVGADPYIGQAGQTTNATYYAADLVHMTNAGYARVAAIAKDSYLRIAAA